MNVYIREYLHEYILAIVICSPSVLAAFAVNYAVWRVFRAKLAWRIVLLAFVCVLAADPVAADCFATVFKVIDLRDDMPLFAAYGVSILVFALAERATKPVPVS